MSRRRTKVKRVETALVGSSSKARAAVAKLMPDFSKQVKFIPLYC